mmetsp:Transcript_25693/g.54262  ORF Transcript_25693/g.54262 Transcript_25693/m.54262 type:complete len:243 (-) Transcript_25693:927-1655(-)
MRVLRGTCPCCFVVPHRLMEALRVEGHESTLGLCARIAMVQPRCPEHGLRKPVALQDVLLILVVLVFQATGVDEVHSAATIAPAEERVAAEEGEDLNGLVADPIHAEGRLLVDPLEERVRPQCRREDLVVKLNVQRFRQVGEEFHILLLHELLRLVQLMVQVPPDLDAKPQRDIVEAEILLEKYELPGRLAIHVPQVGHGIGDAGDEGGECHQGEEDHHDREDPLPHSVCMDLHGGRRELSQ